MRILVIKTSSLGDLVHTLPAVTDAATAVPGVNFDWVVEEAFAELPSWHPAVNTVIPLALRRWRRGWFHAATRSEVIAFLRSLRACSYDRVVDAQGLFKSAMITGLAKGQSIGLDYHSARESWVS